jgi:nucleolar pre-ribosomal-associated protein 2
LEKTSKTAIRLGLVRGWKLRSFLLKYYAAKMEDRSQSTFEGLCRPVDLEKDKMQVDALRPDYSSSIVVGCVDAVCDGLSFNAELEYLESILVGLDTIPSNTRKSDDVEMNGWDEGLERREADDALGLQLVAIRRVVERLKGISIASSQRNVFANIIAGAQSHFDSGHDFNLAKAHAILTKKLLSTTNSKLFGQVAEILFMLLDFASASITQWNVESTLAAASTIISGPEIERTPSDSQRWFTRICKLVGVVISKHRIQIEGRYHLLVSVMQSLLGYVLTGHSKKWDTKTWVAHAQAYTRLVTLICEPMAGSVARLQQASALESATDIAKRSAGKHMYLVLMTHVKLLLENSVEKEVSDALEPGVNSIFDITSPEVRRIINDGLDANGRAILRELFGRYTKFGKWSGV